MKLLILNGPNLNLLGLREPAIYGIQTYADLVQMIEAYCTRHQISVEIKQSNHEGGLVDMIQQAREGGKDGIIINPAAYTHTSIAILDAIKAVGIPTIEVHISDPDTREDFRKISYIREACIDTVKGQGLQGYLIAIDKMLAKLKK